jgi:hypothetical protein
MVTACIAIISFFWLWKINSKSFEFHITSFISHKNTKELGQITSYTKVRPFFLVLNKKISMM